MRKLRLHLDAILRYSKLKLVAYSKIKIEAFAISNPFRYHSKDMEFDSNHQNINPLWNDNYDDIDVSFTMTPLKFFSKEAIS